MVSTLVPDLKDKKNLEKYSSAFTLSDMEVFIFPELLYPLVLANILSPIIWEWRNDEWFRGIEEKSFTYKVNRIKQFIIHNYVFNLDLSTWGLTTKTREIERFSNFFDVETLRQSNALFGYEGDKYYFDIDIRKHFGLDIYNSDIIPYWKTETIEAMTAFRFMENFTSGAGECVSLSALYAAAMFIIGRIPLEKIFLVATPLHSQNFIIEKEGLITNNRRIVTKNMWYNGTSLSAKARRALENERVTIVAHISGYIHTLYNKATISKEAYKFFSHKLRHFLNSRVTDIIFINFLRFKSRYKSLFQYRYDSSGFHRFISLEKMFEYEHTSKYSLLKETRDMLVNEIEGDEFHLSPIQGKIILNDVEDLFKDRKGMDIHEFRKEFLKSFHESSSAVVEEMLYDLHNFIFTDPKIPAADKEYSETVIPEISQLQSREEIINTITKLADRSETALLTLYTYRQMDIINWIPFIKAAIERNPVCFADLKGKSSEDVYQLLTRLPDESIYEGNRLALPDEVWNFKRGDGIEKAFLLANFVLLSGPSANIDIEITAHKVNMRIGSGEYKFSTMKSLRKAVKISVDEYSAEDLP